MREWVDLLLLRRWWQYHPKTSSWVEFVYHNFNLFEGVVWFLMAGLVARRYQAHRHSWVEGIYALTFLTFGLTDFREAVALDSWLIWLKLVNLIMLMKIRAWVIRKYYPTSRLF